MHKPSCPMVNALDDPKKIEFLIKVNSKIWRNKLVQNVAGSIPF